MSYFNHLRSIYLELISRNANFPIYFCEKTKQPRPLIKVFFKDDADNQRHLKDAHELSRNYLKVETKHILVEGKANIEEAKRTKGDVKQKMIEIQPSKIELKALREENNWVIVKNKKDVIATNKRPLIALSEALLKIDANSKQIIICGNLKELIKNTNKNKITNESMKAAIKVIENRKLFING